MLNKAAAKSEAPPKPPTPPPEPEPEPDIVEEDGFGDDNPGGEGLDGFEDADGEGDDAEGE